MENLLNEIDQLTIIIKNKIIHLESQNKGLINREHTFDKYEKLEDLKIQFGIDLLNEILLLIESKINK